MHVIPIRLPMSNAYLIKGDRPILVDTGKPGDEQRIVRALAAAGVRPADLSLILHTHGHSDHAGSSAALQGMTRARLAMHAADDAMARRGKNKIGARTSLEARLLAPIVDRPFPPVVCDLLLRDEVSLEGFGVDGRVLFTPGHTDGSISILLGNGDAIVGDLLMGGVFGGAIAGSRPRLHYFVEDYPQVLAGVERVLGEGASRLYVGHGGPLAREDVVQWSARLRPAAMS
jgi:glyoxylase-like metal-dependent hydrolase (beta-lactamase superfamily II)